MPIVKILLFIVLAIVAIKLFFFAVGVFTILAWALLLILIVALVSWVCFRFLMPTNEQKKTAEKSGPQVWNHSGNVVLFEEKPNLLQITKVDHTTSGIIKLPNGEGIKIVEEAENVLKVKVLSGEHKGNVAWVSKADVTGYKTAN
ncbi:MAG: hypothetical protein IT342_15820 [Candidatus Melainabacteria bacterium]|nr:hypothetical protein [Candidatus Melainabacteria bacterium]